jgi:hypothetical protein
LQSFYRLRASRRFAFALIFAALLLESLPFFCICVARAFAFAARFFVSTGYFRFFGSPNCDGFNDFRFFAVTMPLRYRWRGSVPFFRLHDEVHVDPPLVPQTKPQVGARGADDRPSADTRPMLGWWLHQSVAP